MENLKVNVKKLNSDAVIPAYAKEGDAGLDLVAISKERKGDIITYGTGLAFEIPKGHVGYIFPRSSISKKAVRLANSVGVIDSGYRGEVKFKFDNTYPEGNQEEYTIGDRVGQLIIMPIPYVELIETEKLSDSNRGEGGFGSTGE